jgi:hypothetical protein
LHPEYEIEDVPEADQNAAENPGARLDEPKLRLLPTPSPTIHLKTLDHVRIEMAKLYRDMKRGKIATQDGTRLTYVLSQIGKLIEAGELENRIEALETVLRQRKLPR